MRGAAVLQLLGAFAFQVALGRVESLTCTQIDSDDKLCLFFLSNMVQMFPALIHFDLDPLNAECELYGETMEWCYIAGETGMRVCQLAWLGKHELLRVYVTRDTNALVDCSISIQSNGLHDEDQLGEFTPLHLAAYRGHKVTVTTLLQLGAEIDGGAFDGSTPLFCAVSQNHPDVVRTLLEHRANVNCCVHREPGWQNYMTARAGFTPLILAVNSDMYEIATMLLTEGRADANLYTGPLVIEAYGMLLS